MIHEEYIYNIFKQLFLYYLKTYQPECRIMFEKKGAHVIPPGMDWFMYLEGRLLHPDMPEFVFNVQLYRNGSEPDDPRLEIRYTVKWSMDRFDSEEAFDFLHRIFNALLDDVTVKAREDGVFIFEQEFGILEDGDYDRRLFTYKNEQDMPVDLLLDNHLIVDPFLEETNSFFSQMQESLPTILAAILVYSEKMQDMNRELFLSEDNDTEQGLMGLDFFKAYQSEIEDA